MIRGVSRSDLRERVHHLKIPIFATVTALTRSLAKIPFGALSRTRNRVIIVHVSGRTDFFLFGGSKREGKRRGIPRGDLRNGLYSQLREIDDTRSNSNAARLHSCIAAFSSSFFVAYIFFFLLLSRRLHPSVQ